MLFADWICVYSKDNGKKLEKDEKGREILRRNESGKDELKNMKVKIDEKQEDIGVMIGLSVPKEKRKIPFLGSLLVFLVTYFPLMGKFIRVIKVERKKQTA